MRHGRILAVVTALFAAGCSSSSKPLKDMVGYVPPTSLPAQPKRTLVADREDQVWSQLLAFLEGSAFKIDHIDREKNLVVARYSGNPQPYIDCGSIVTHQGGKLDQLAGSASTIALNYELDQEPVVLNRQLSLDSRIIISVVGRPQGTVIETDTTYVVTKTVDVTDQSGGVQEGSRETVSFKAGDRAEFTKGTTCQPNGSLDLAVLQSLPNVVGSDEINRAELADDGFEAADLALLDEAITSEPLSPPPDTSSEKNQVLADNQVDAAASSAEDLEAAATPPTEPGRSGDDWELPTQGLPNSALPAPANPVSPQGAQSGEPEQDVAARSLSPTTPTSSNDDEVQNDRAPEAQEVVVTTPSPSEDLNESIGNPQSPATIVDDTTRKLLDSLNCGGEEWHFCDLVEITSPYRKRNIEQLFGLTINTSESFTSQIVGSNLKLDILFPSFSSHLHIAYARRDGTVEHIVSSSEVWPADLAHQLIEEEKAIPGPEGLAMIIAIASQKPLFSSPPEGVENATVYLNQLKQSLAELERESPNGPIAASQLLIYVENAET